jgi:hypothetical protein
VIGTFDRAIVITNNNRRFITHTPPGRSFRPVSGPGVDILGTCERASGSAWGVMVREQASTIENAGVAVSFSRRRFSCPPPPPPPPSPRPAPYLQKPLSVVVVDVQRGGGLPPARRVELRAPDLEGAGPRLVRRLAVTRARRKREGSLGRHRRTRTHGHTRMRRMIRRGASARTSRSRLNVGERGWGGGSARRAAVSRCR